MSILNIFKLVVRRLFLAVRGQLGKTSPLMGWETAKKFLKMVVDKYLNKIIWDSCYRILILLTQYHVLMSQLVEQLRNGMKICCWTDHTIANLEMFSFGLMMPSFAEWTVIVEFKIWTAALLPTSICILLLQEICLTFWSGERTQTKLQVASQN